MLVRLAPPRARSQPLSSAGQLRHPSKYIRSLLVKETHSNKHSKRTLVESLSSPSRPKPPVDPESDRCDTSFLTQIHHNHYKIHHNHYKIHHFLPRPASWRSGARRAGCPRSCKITSIFSGKTHEKRPKERDEKHAHVAELVLIAQVEALRDGEPSHSVPAIIRERGLSIAGM